MSRRLVLLPLLFLACYSLDSFLFEPVRVDEYLRPEDIHEDWHVNWVIPLDTFVESVTLTPETGETVFGFFVRARPDTAPAPTVVYCHGKSQSINRYWGRVELLWQAGCNVFIFDYEGYGRSTGTPSARACYADADAALRWCLDRTDIDTSRIVYYGWSLGSFMAMHLAADVREPRAVLLENPMASTSAIAREGALLAVPGSFVAEADFDNETRIQTIDGTRVLILFGRKDETAVPERNVEVLMRKARKAGIDADSVEVPTAGHSDLPEEMTYETYRRTVSDFFSGRL